MPWKRNWKNTRALPYTWPEPEIRIWRWKKDVTIQKNILIFNFILSISHPEKKSLPRGKLYRCITSEIEDYIDGCKYQPLSKTNIIVNKEEIDELINLGGLTASSYFFPGSLPTITISVLLETLSLVVIWNRKIIESWSFT